ncbi:hypothetical protein CGZ98_13190 [Enemella evansiae]|uniref:type IV toxin-antitoxin system AbiEi family antitoxin domain-containing protein n=1 Tax=Enemella evansiae TaxID=2016499 RepID=UPI000B978C4E|nr:type IV toxin-antitoxin system AbiEi family antitoxin domain-containing protein [Enemella evansiae]OYO10049.1 hypothetical protein CGZ98_13190 [Enemella evansiae]
MGQRAQVQQLLADHGGVITLRDAGGLREAVRWLVRAGDLVPLLPGCYAAAGLADEPLIRAVAMRRYAPDAVLIGRSAAMFTGWPELAPTMLTVAAPRRRVPSRHPGYVWTRRPIDPEWVQQSGGISCTNQFLTAVDLIPELGGQPVDDVLRRHRENGAWALGQLWRAFHAHPNRPGNTVRRQILDDSRDRPWSEAERLAHRLLREAGLDGFRTNFPVSVDGSLFYLDVAFPELKLAIEINGFERHGQRQVFEDDHPRRNSVTLDGWLVLEFTWRMITEHPDLFVATVLRGIEQR